MIPNEGYLKRFPSTCGIVVPGAKHAWSLQFPYLFADMDRPLPEEMKKLKR